MEEQKNEWWKNVDPNKPKDPNKISKGMLRKAMRAMCLNNCCAGQQTEVVECTVRMPRNNGKCSNRAVEIVYLF